MSYIVDRLFLPIVLRFRKWHRILANSFVTREPKIRNGLQSISHDKPQFSVTDTNKTIDFVFDRFQPVTEEHMRKVVVKRSSATCVIDPIPTQMLKKCISSKSRINKDYQHLIK